MSRSFEVPEPPELEEQTGASFALVVRLMQRLLAPDGCPWDREQTPQSLCRYVLEEACELIDAIEADDPSSVREELGDLALQIAFLSELYRKDEQFGPDEVMTELCTKLVRRHPHVFADAEVEDSDGVVVAWERIKQEEKRRRPLLDSIPRNLPALLRAERSSAAVAQVGFDWSNAAGSRQKVDEELGELAAAVEEGDRSRVEDEFGDTLFAMVNWARHLGIEPEGALRRACDKFRGRFDEVERLVRREHEDWPRDERGRPTRGVPFEQLDAYWELAKKRHADAER